MPFLHVILFIIFIVLMVKFAVMLSNFLVCLTGRCLGFGVKWQSDHGEFVVVIGATGAVGKEYAREFASMDFNLMLVGRSLEKLEKIGKEFKERYKVEIIKNVAADFAMPGGLEVVKNALKSIQPITVFVNCLGMSFNAKRFSDFSDSLNQELLNVNLIAPFHLLQVVLPIMVEQGRGVIINYSSQCGDFRFPYYATYSACRSFMSTLTEIVSLEYKDKGIVIQNVKPLFIHSQSAFEVKPNFFMVSPAASVYDAMRVVGVECSTYGTCRHKLVATLLNFAVFIVGQRMTSWIIMQFYDKFFTTFEQNSIEAGDSDTSVRSNDGVGNKSSKRIEISSSSSSLKVPKHVSIMKIDNKTQLFIKEEHKGEVVTTKLKKQSFTDVKMSKKSDSGQKTFKKHHVEKSTQKHKQDNFQKQKSETTEIKFDTTK